MKKILTICLILVMILSITACGGDAGKEAVKLALGETYTVEGYAEFSLFKIQTTKEITASVDSTFSYEAEGGNKYVDLILDIKNIGDVAVSCDDIVSVSATNESGATYTCSTYLVESKDGTNIDSYTDIKPLESTRLHCATSVKDDEKSLSLTLNVNGEEYTYDYILTEVVRNAETITTGQVIESESFAKLVFNGVTYTDDLMPSNTSGFYTHYPVDDSNNTYLAINLKLTNYQSSARELESFVGAKATYMDKYSYTGFIVVEEGDKTGFDSYADLSPLTEYNAYILIEVPKTVIENDALVELSFAGNEYLYAFAK